MTDFQFDDSLKNIIGDHGSAVPDDIWERIIQKKDKDRKGLLFFFRWLAVLILGVCLGGYFLMHLTEQKSEPTKHLLSGRNDSNSQNRSSSQDLNQNATTPASNLNKEGVRTEGNSSTVAQHLPISKKASYSSHPSPAGKKAFYSSNRLRESNDNKSNFKSTSDEKAVSEAAVSAGAVSVAAAKGMQNSALQKDSLSGNDSASKTKGMVNKPVPVVKPVSGKSPSDSAQKAAVKKTQKDSAADKKWYLDIYASPDWPMDHTTYPPSAYLIQQMKLSYTLGLRINRAFGKHFSGKIGIQFSQINYTYPDSINYLNEKVYHLKSWDIPFLAGYSFGNEKLKMTITAGGIVNLTSFTGDTLVNIFKTNSGLSLYLGFNLEKKINQKISVYLEPYYRYRLTPMTISSVEFDKFIDVVGLSFGARYYFLKPSKK